MTRMLSILLACVVLVFVAGCGGDDSDSSDGGGGGGGADKPAEPSGGSKAPAGKADVTVDMKDIKFMPANVNVKVGGTVGWVNKDSVPHNVTKEDGPGAEFASDTVIPAASSARSSTPPARSTTSARSTRTRPAPSPSNRRGGLPAGVLARLPAGLLAGGLVQLGLLLGLGPVQLGLGAAAGRRPARGARRPGVRGAGPRAPTRRSARAWPRRLASIEARKPPSSRSESSAHARARSVTVTAPLPPAVTSDRTSSVRRPLAVAVTVTLPPPGVASVAVTDARELIGRRAT